MTDFMARAKGLFPPACPQLLLGPPVPRPPCRPLAFWLLQGHTWPCCSSLLATEAREHPREPKPGAEVRAETPFNGVSPGRRGRGQGAAPSHASPQQPEPSSSWKTTHEDKNQPRWRTGLQHQQEGGLGTAAGRYLKALRPCLGAINKANRAGFCSQKACYSCDGPRM